MEDAKLLLLSHLGAYPSGSLEFSFACSWTFRSMISSSLDVVSIYQVVAHSENDLLWI